MVRVGILIFISLIGFGGNAFATEEVAQGFTLDGRLYADSAATTPLADLVSLKIQILNQAQDCILYEETQSVNTTSSQGYYTLQVGQKMGPPAGKRSSGDSNNSLARVFSNSAVAFNGKQLSDGTTVCAYTPSAGHVRYMKITMTPSDGISRSTTTNMLIDSVPMALVAERAESLQGYTPAQFIQVNNTTSALTQSNLESILTTTGVSRITDLISVPASSYVRTPTNGGASLPSVAGNPSSPSVGQIWYDSVANQVKYYDGAVKTLGTVSSSFVNGGNSFGAAATLGTADNFDLNFAINGSNRMTLDTSGRLGIGTTTPGTKLDVVDGTIGVRSGTITPIIAAYSSNTQTNPALITFQAARGGGYPVANDIMGNFDWRSQTGNSTEVSSRISAIATESHSTTQVGGALTFSTTPNTTKNLLERVRIDHNGYVGIGTTTPATKLHITTNDANASFANNVAQTNLILQNLNTTVNNWTQLSFHSASGSISGGIGVQNTNHTNHRGDMAFYTRGPATSVLTEKMRITGDGNVGIGTNNPGAPLEIASGNIRLSNGGIEVPQAAADPLIFTDFANANQVLAGAVPSGNTVVIGKLGTSNQSLLVGAYDWSGSGAFKGMRAGPSSYSASFGFYYTNWHNSNPNTGLTAGDADLEFFAGGGKFFEIDAGLGESQILSTPVTANGGMKNAQLAFLSTYDSDATGGITSSNYSMRIANTMISGGGSPSSRLDFKNNANTNLMSISSGGNVAIGTTNTSYRLSVVGTGGSTVAQFADGAQACSITPSVAGSITCSSDERLKRDIASVEDLDSLEKILQLRTVTYKWKKGDDKEHTGYIAQEVQEIAPEMVHTSPDGLKQVSYVGFIPWITGAIKEIYRQFSEELAQMKSENNEMKERTAKLERENEELKRRLEALERKINSR